MEAPHWQMDMAAGKSHLRTQGLEWALPVLARILCSLLTKSAMYCLLTVLEEPAQSGFVLHILLHSPFVHEVCVILSQFL